MNGLAITPADILDFGLQAVLRGDDVVLVTLVGIDGSSPRALGAQMMVDRRGHYCGSFTAGCVEAAIVGEAQAVLDKGESRLVRFGVGSPYIDIRLPCGGGIDLLFTPRPDPIVLTAVGAALARRESVAMRISHDGVSLAESHALSPPSHDGAFYASYSPRLRILLFGQGETLIATARLAQFIGAVTAAFSPSLVDMETLHEDGIDCSILPSRSSSPPFDTDQWTAIGFLFHDHDWEHIFLPAALRRSHLFVGAIGGEQSRKSRMALLNAEGINQTLLKNFVSPVGLIPSARDPSTLALSIVTQMVSAYHSNQQQQGLGQLAFSSAPMLL